MSRLWMVLFIICVWLNLGYAQEVDTTGDWTEGTAVIFDQIDGSFEPQLTGSFMMFRDEKGLGWFFGENDRTGPIVMWRAWWLLIGDTRTSVFLIGSTDLGDTQEEQTFFNDGLIGLELRFHWIRMKNLEIGAGILPAAFKEGEEARITPYVRLAFRL